MTKQEEIFIDANGCVLGRIAAFAAKKALQGNRVVILNSEKVVVIGKKKKILEYYYKKFTRSKGTTKGAYVSRISDKLMHRTVRGMLPWKKSKGREAFRQVSCFKSVPEKYKDKKKVVVAKADAINFLTLQDICKLLGKEK